jgi:lambda repressor-like predicted transcriptional regulator
MTDRNAQLRYEKQWRLDRARGIDRSFVPAAKSAVIVRELNDLGCSLAAIAHAAGMSTSGMLHVFDGEYATLQRAHAQALEALTLHDVIDRALDSHYLPRWAAQRRIQALMALGHSHERITEFLRPGLRSHNVLGPNPVTAPYLRANTWRDVDRVYSQLMMTPGPSLIARTRAVAKGFMPPLAWEDIDDPHEKPTLKTDHPETIDSIAIERTLNGDWARLTNPEINEALRLGASRGLDCGEMAVLLRMNKEAVQRRANRYGIHTTDRRLAA